MKSMWFKVLGLSVLFIVFFTSCFNKSQKAIFIEIWHHYDGAQKIAFDKLVTEFNETEGIGKGIIVEAFSQGSTDELEKKIVDTAHQKVGAGDLPDIFSAYPESVHSIDKMGIIVDLENYMKKSEVKNYEDIYVDEGYIGENKELKMFPIAKSTEIMMINKTDWDKFSNETGANLKDLETWEGLARVAEKYYSWSGGKAFFARDNMANYMLEGSSELGEEIFIIEEDLGIVNIDNDIMRKLWDNYYIPYVNGYYGPFSKFSSDDLKTGKIIAYVASTGEVNYFPKNVTIDYKDSHKIKPLMLPVPSFANTKPSAVLQGAGMVVLKSDETREKAAVEFLKWFTKPPKNIEFSITTGYLPVGRGLGQVDTLGLWLDQEAKGKMSDQVKMSLPIAAKQIEEYDICINKAFNNSAAARDVLSASLINRAKGDRAKVTDLIDKGVSKKEAVDTIITESNFEQWVVRFKMELRGVVQ